MLNEILIGIRNNVFILFYGVALVLSIIRYRKYFDSILRYLPILIGYTFFTELLGNLVGQSEKFQIIYIEGFSIENSVIYNIFDIIIFLYFSYVYLKALKGIQSRKIIKYGALLFIVVSLINPFFQDFIILPQIGSILVGSLLLVLSTFFYLKELNTSKSTISNNRNLLFWISYGLLIFYILYPIIMIIGIYFGEQYKELHIRRFHITAICIMYTCFIIGFLRMRRMKPVQEENK